MQKKQQQYSAGGRLVPAVDRAARIFEILRTNDQPMSITELARELNASKGTVREILETLRRHGLLERNDETKLYRLGPELVKLGASSREGRSLVAASRPHLVSLSDSQREIAVLLVPHENRLLIQEAVEPANPRVPILVSATPGRTLAMTSGPCGKAFMAFCDDILRERLLRSLRKSRKSMEREIEDIRRRGYAIDDEEFMEGVRGVAAPITGYSGNLVGVIMLSGVSASFARSRIEKAGKATRTAANAVSAALGGFERLRVGLMANTESSLDFAPGRQVVRRRLDTSWEGEP